MDIQASNDAVLGDLKTLINSPVKALRVCLLSLSQATTLLVCPGIGIPIAIHWMMFVRVQQYESLRLFRCRSQARRSCGEKRHKTRVRKRKVIEAAGDGG